MQYTKSGNVHRLVRITGPAHNLLGIEFGDSGAEECVIERLGPDHGSSLQDQEVKEWVVRAVAKANLEFGTRMNIRRIQYITTDTRDEKAYAIMARELTQRARPA